jgi:ribosome assembly protein YihI (activator of Der GTPase)
MKIRQNLIDNIVSLDLTREQLAKQLLTARYTSLKHKAEAEWLDQLADLLRDGEGVVKQKRIYDEYQDRITDLMDIYRDRDNES